MVIAIIAILIALLLPALAAARATAYGAMCLSNDRQHNFALNQYFTDWQGYFPLAGEYFAFTNLGRPNRTWMDVISYYHGITSNLELGPLGSFPGYLLSKDPEGYEIWRDPARLGDTAGGVFRFGKGNYWAMGGEYMFMDERAHTQDPSLPAYDHVDRVAVPAKTMWLYCHEDASSQPGIWVWHTGYHSGGSSFAFIDGHAEIASVEPLNEYWVATGGSPFRRTEARGNFIYTYPPVHNDLGTLSEAEWWIPPHYPDGPVYHRQP